MSWPTTINLLSRAGVGDGNQKPWPAEATGLIGQNIPVPVGVLAGDDDAGLVGVLAGRHGGIDRHNDADQVWNILVRRPSHLLDQRAGPEGTWHIIEYFSVQLLATEPCALVFLD